MFFIPFVIFLLTSVSYGSYVGFDVRHERGVSDHAISGISGITNFTFTDNAAVSMRGLGAGFFAGYGNIVQNIYMGVEAGIAANGVSGGKSVSVLNGINSTSTLSAHKDYTLSLVGRLGMPIRKALVYAKAGAMVARYRFVVAVDSLANGVDASYRWDRRLVHLVTGAGIEVDVLPSIRLGAEYMHVLGKTVRFSASSSSFESLCQFSPSADFVSIRLIFAL